MFHAVDVDDSGAISFDEFCQWMLTMLCGTAQSKLRLGFNLCDLVRLTRTFSLATHFLIHI